MAMFPDTTEKLGSVSKPQVTGSFVHPTGKGGAKGDKISLFRFARRQRSSESR